VNPSRNDMTDKPSIAAAGSELNLYSLLDSSDDFIKELLIRFIRESGVKFSSPASFENDGWPGGPTPKFAQFWKVQGTAVVPSRDPFIWDLREPLLHDLALACCCVLLYRRSRKYAVRWIGGIETAAIPLVAGMLAVGLAHGGPPLNGFYLRKKRKTDGLRRLLEGPPPPRGERVLLIDDILNKGIAKKPLLNYCVSNGLTPSGLLVVVDTERQGAELFAPICPVESIFTRSDVLRTPLSEFERPGGSVSNATSVLAGDVSPRADTDRWTKCASLHSASERCSSPAELAREDIELVRLARDTVVYAALSRGEFQPTIGDDGRGSPGYSPFLGRYMRERGAVFTRISKREFRDGKWLNRLRGCQAVGLMQPVQGTIADMTVKSALATATRARKVKPGPPVFHKPVWREETGALSLFVYVVEQFVPTAARTAEQLLEEGHDVRNWGLIAQCGGFRGVVCGDLPAVPDIQAQIAAVCRKMQNSLGTFPQDANKVSFIRMKGRWLWDPVRPKPEYF
jgi:orotate phosphoribosyltransferase